jgi:23S rRNA (pseudouridine1915-N3)-methyltransferase
MKLQVAAIGLLKQGPEKDLAAEYETRIPTLGKKAGISGLMIRDWGESKLPDTKQRMAAEAKDLWSIVPDSSPVFALDERGKALASADWAKLLSVNAAQGAKTLTFMIGGPDGHAPETRTRATQLLSFGPATWPHRLARVMLLEQIYRSVTILVNHPYHRA